MVDYMVMTKFVTRCKIYKKLDFILMVSSDMNIMVLVVYKNIHLREMPKIMKNLDMQKLKMIIKK